jgi:alkylation response protein AidB-like acyl-CoA dehydrogenase
MTTSISASDRQELQASIREAFDDLSPSARVRELMATAAGWDPGDWARLCTQLGVAGIAVDEKHGGSGMSFRESGLLFEEAGRSLLCAPLFSVAGLAVPLLTSLGPDPAGDALLAQLTSGDVVATVVAADGQGRYGVAHLGVRAEGDQLTGRGGYVVDGATADVLLVPARTDDGIGVFLVPGDAPGLTRTPLVTLDQTRKQAHVDVAWTPATRIGGGDQTVEVERAFAIARALLACEQVGVAQRCLDLTVEFAKTRIQFGRPIGSFQAIKQRLAELLIKIESARSAAGVAAAAAADDSDDLGWKADVAKAYCSEAVMAASADTIQLHGGIGFTWEHDAHLYFKRARSTEELLGTPREHYDRIAAHLAAT